MSLLSWWLLAMYTLLLAATIFQIKLLLYVSIILYTILIIKTLAYSYWSLNNSNKRLNLFGERGRSHIEKRGHTYVVVRDIDGEILVKSHTFKKYKDCTIRMMYTGVAYGTGDYILVADTEDGSKEIYRWYRYEY